MTATKSSSTRVPAIDALRGLCLVLMTIDHLPDGPLQRFSNIYFGPFGFFTAASGFVFLSGWVAGRVYGRQRRLYDDAFVSRRVVVRIGKLYLAQMVLALSMWLPTAMHFRAALNLNLDLLWTSPWKGLLMCAALLYQGSYLGILPMYIVFLWITPLLLRQLQAGHLKKVLLWSGAIWLCSGLMIRLPHDRAGVNFGFNPLSYQILFVMGIILGETRFDLSSLRTSTRDWLVTSSIALATTFYLFRFGYSLLATVRNFIDGRMGPFFSLNEMGPLRVLNFTVFGVCIWWVYTRLNSANLNHPSIEWLVLLGKNSLVVFVWSVIITMTVQMAQPSNSPTTLRLGIMLLAVASLTVPALLVSIGVHKITSVEFSGSSSSAEPHIETDSHTFNF
jgi:hypothetical protein